MHHRARTVVLVALWWSVVCTVLGWPGQIRHAWGQQPLTQAQQPTELQLELRLAEESLTHQRSLCAHLWAQGNNVERQLAQIREELTKEKAEHAKTKEELGKAKESADAPNAH